MIYKRYKELTRELVHTKLDLKYLRIRLERLKEESGQRGVRSSSNFDEVRGSPKITNITQLYKDISDCVHSIAVLEVTLKRLEDLKTEYETEIQHYASKFNDLEAKVFILRHVEMKSLVDIACDLNYEYGTIRNINSILTRKIKADYVENDKVMTKK